MKECNIIRDLLPLYAEHMTSEDTRTYVDQHIANCTACRAELDKLAIALPAAPVDSAAPLKNIRRQLMRRRTVAALIAASWTFALLLTLFAYLTAPQYLPYADDLVTVTRHEDQAGDAGDCVLLTFREDVAGCDGIQLTTTDGGQMIYTISAWTTVLDRLNPPSARSSASTIIEPANKFSVYYAQNAHGEDILLYGEDVNPDGGIVTLPRLTLGYYAVLAAALFVLLLFAALLLRNARHWIIRLALLPLSYLIGHACIKGLTFATYSLQRDLALILLMTLLVFTGALLVFLHNHQRK